MPFNKKLLAVAILAQPLAVAPLAAQEEDNFEASISLGYVGTSGNTDTDTFNMQYLMSYVYASWDHNLKFQALGSQENAEATAERYYLENKSDFNLNENQYLYGKVSYTDDRFSGFNYQAVVSGGYGHNLINTETLELEAYGGVGYRSNNQIEGPVEGETIISLGENFRWDISENAVLTQNFTTEIGDIRTVSTFEAGLETNIIGGITTKVAFQVRHNSDVPVGREKTDTLTSVSLVYNF